MHERADGGARAAKFPRWSAYCVTRNVTRGVVVPENDGKTMKGPKAVSWFSRCRAGLAATNVDEEPWTCPPHASMVRDRKLLLLPLVNPLCFSPLFASDFFLFSPPPSASPSLPPSRPSPVIEQPDITSNPCSLFVVRLRSTLLRPSSWKGRMEGNSLSLSLLKRVLIPRS